MDLCYVIKTSLALKLYILLKKKSGRDYNCYIENGIVLTQTKH